MTYLARTDCSMLLTDPVKARSPCPSYDLLPMNCHYTNEIHIYMSIYTGQLPTHRKMHHQSDQYMRIASVKFTCFTCKVHPTNRVIARRYVPRYLS